LQFPEEMRSADEKLAKPLHGDRLPKVAAKTDVNAVVDVLKQTAAGRYTR
jgi:predicted transcriptional regulator